MKSLISLGILSFLFNSIPPACDAPASRLEATMITSGPRPEIVIEKNGIKLTSITETDQYPGASLSIASPASNEDYTKPSVNFIFRVLNYQLKKQTDNAKELKCANSKDGQHIHFILDNSPYQALYDTVYMKKDIKDGHHVLLAFLSRSYHMSIKEPGAFLVKEFNTGTTAEDNFNEKSAHLFYSRPKGDYLGENNAKRVLLDFYLVNCKLSNKGYKVRATINGTEFMLNKWSPYIMEGLPMGENKIRLELLDKAGKTVQSPFNPVERSFTLSTSEPLPAK